MSATCLSVSYRCAFLLGVVACVYMQRQSSCWGSGEHKSLVCVWVVFMGEGAWVGRGCGLRAANVRYRWEGS